jgi:hypothetical protein
MFTWDDLGVEQNHREIGVEMSRWGNPASKNAQYVIQPYYVAANVARFSAPAGRLTHSFRWEPGRVSFKSVLGLLGKGGGRTVAQHDFTSGVPTPGGESIRINLYVFGYSTVRLKNRQHPKYGHDEGTQNLQARGNQVSARHLCPDSYLLVCYSGLAPMRWFSVLLIHHW